MDNNAMLSRIDEAKEDLRIALTEYISQFLGVNAVFYDIEKGVDIAIKHADDQLCEALSKQAEMEGRN